VKADRWLYSTIHHCACKVIEVQALWGETVCRVWLPNQDVVVRVAQSALTSLHQAAKPESERWRIAYTTAATRVAEVLEGASDASGERLLLAPMESNVIPLPHQIHALSRAISGDRVRYLLADEVGLGKTIEAGLIMRELKLRGLVRRTLVVAPKSLALQWVAEMRTHFNESFAYVQPSDLDAVERLLAPGMLEADDATEENPWRRVSQAVVTLDAVKPLMRRKGWSKERVLEYNRIRYENLITGNWDLIIVDESHRLGGSNDLVARFRLGQGLAEAAPYLLLLSATPHQGKSDAFHRLMSLLDPMTFPDMESINRDKVAEYVIRTEKRKALTAQGEPLFRPRTTKTLSVNLSGHAQQLKLYNEVTAYVREGYNQAIQDKKPHIGFLMVLLQRIATSSTYAIRCTLERRQERLMLLTENQDEPIDSRDDQWDEWSELDGQEQLDQLVEVNEQGLEHEQNHVAFLLALARQTEAAGPDVKTSLLLDLIYTLQGEEHDDQLKLLIFTEFVATQKMLQTFLEDCGISCAILNGSMTMDERRIAQRQFRDHARILIATDAGGEGLNLQFCHVVINYDLPWNPMRIEQRIGRVDRIGQEKTVRAMNFVYAESVESRVREVLETKLAIILGETGIDKSNDILETPISAELIERMMTHVMMEDASPEEEVDRALNAIQSELVSQQEQCAAYAVSEQPDLSAVDKLRNHPLPHWLERMTTSYLSMHECPVHLSVSGVDFTWPDGKHVQNGQFTSLNRPMDQLDDAALLTLENSRIRGLALNLPAIIPPQPIPSVTIRDIPASISGSWGLFEIRLQVNTATCGKALRIPLLRRAFLCLFVDEKEKIFIPTARHIWEVLLTDDPCITNMIHDPALSSAIFTRLSQAAEHAGRDLFDNLQHAHLAALEKEKTRADHYFSSKRKGIERLGLPEVRQYRLTQCEQEEADWRNELQAARQLVPEIKPLLLLKINDDVTRE